MTNKTGGQSLPPIIGQEIDPHLNAWSLMWPTMHSAQCFTMLPLFRFYHCGAKSASIQRFGGSHFGKPVSRSPRGVLHSHFLLHFLHKIKKGPKMLGATIEQLYVSDRKGMLGCQRRRWGGAPWHRHLGGGQDGDAKVVADLTFAKKTLSIICV